MASVVSAIKVSAMNCSMEKIKQLAKEEKAREILIERLVKEPYLSIEKRQEVISHTELFLNLGSHAPASLIHGSKSPHCGYSYGSLQTSEFCRRWVWQTFRFARTQLGPSDPGVSVIRIPNALLKAWVVNSLLQYIRVLPFHSVLSSTRLDWESSGHCWPAISVTLNFSDSLTGWLKLGLLVTLEAHYFLVFWDVRNCSETVIITVNEWVSVTLCGWVTRWFSLDVTLSLSPTLGRMDIMHSSCGRGGFKFNP